MNDYTVMMQQRHIAQDAERRAQQAALRETIKQPKQPLIRFGWILRFNLRKPAALRRVTLPTPAESQACTTA